MQTEGVRKQTVQDQASEDKTIETNGAEASVGREQAVSNAVQRLLSVVIGLVLTVALAVWGLYVLHPVDPYVQSVLALTGDPARGREIFKLNCATCHGLEAAGEVGPDLRNVSERKSQAALIDQVISGKTPPMPQFQPGERDMADLLSFLETL